MASTSINLFRSESKQTTDFLEPVETQFRNFSIIGITLVILVGVITLMLYTTVKTRNQILIGTKTRLVRQLDAQKAKESLLVVLKSRLKMVQTAMDKSRRLSYAVDKALFIATPPVLDTISEDEKQNRFVVTLRPGSLEEAFDYSNRIVQLINDNSVTSAKLESLTVGKVGMRMIISFVPLFKLP